MPFGMLSYWLVLDMFALGRYTLVGGGIASKYFEIRPGRPPTSMNPVDEKEEIRPSSMTHHNNNKYP